MENTDKKVEAGPEKQKQFKLNVVREGAITVIGAGKSNQIILNHGTSAIKATPKNKLPKDVPVADQAILKSVYDAGPEMTKFVVAPDGYKAPWAS